MPNEQETEINERGERGLDHVPTSEELLLLYQRSQESDPASPYYKRVLIRPKLHILRVTLCLVVTLALAVGLSLLVYGLSRSVPGAILSGVAWILLVVLIHGKHIVIWLVMAYQRLAPSSLRERCRYEPSCSQYMIASIRTYGLWKGMKRGFERWRRCKPPYGGFDAP